MDNPYHDQCTHIIRPSAQLAYYAVAKGLRPFSQWVQLTTADRFIVGPYNFAVVNERKPTDRVYSVQWELLDKYKHLFNNATPCLSLPDYSVHYRQFHTSFLSSPNTVRVVAYLSVHSSPSKVSIYKRHSKVPPNPEVIFLGEIIFLTLY